MNKQKLILVCLLLFTVFCGTADTVFSDQTIVLDGSTTAAPVIDGYGNDAIWQTTAGIVTHSNRANVDVEIKAVRKDDMIFFIVQYPDRDESRSHRTLAWNKKTEMYDSGPDREDCFIFKWNMGPKDVDLSIYADQGHEADIWFWKAYRTDPAGFADDKMHILSQFRSRKSKPLKSKSGNKMYLQRIVDTGVSAYTRDILVEYKGDAISGFVSRHPQGSRADVKAKGNWRDGKWSIEFARRLDTGHNDDIAFIVGGKYQFGVAISEIAGRKPDNDNGHSIYGSDDISEHLYLEVK